MTELKPCPFCGCEVKFDTTDSFGVRLLHPKTDCIGWRMTRSIITYSRMDREWLVNGWNKRVGE